MKGQFLGVVLISGMCLFGVTSCTVEDGVVTDRPSDVVDVTGQAHGPDWIWIDGEWTWGGGVYHW